MVQGWTAFDKSLEDAKLAIVQTGTSSSWYRQAARLKLASDVCCGQKHRFGFNTSKFLAMTRTACSKPGNLSRRDMPRQQFVFLHIFREHLERFEVAALMQREASLLTNLKDRLDYTERLLDLHWGRREYTIPLLFLSHFKRSVSP